MASKHTENQKLIQEYSAYRDELITFAEAPFDNATKEPKPPQFPDSHQVFMMHSFGSRYREMRWSSSLDELRDSLLLTEIALHAYRLERKQNPQNLNQLVPAYLKKVPRDAFGKREPLRTLSAKRLLYPSGRGLRTRGADWMHRFQKACRVVVRPESKGDMVAGVN